MLHIGQCGTASWGLEVRAETEESGFNDDSRVVGRRVGVLAMLHSSVSTGLSCSTLSMSATLQLRPDAPPLVNEPHAHLRRRAPLQRDPRKGEAWADGERRVTLLLTNSFFSRLQGNWVYSKNSHSVAAAPGGNAARWTSKAIPCTRWFISAIQA